MGCCGWGFCGILGAAVVGWFPTRKSCACLCSSGRIASKPGQARVGQGLTDCDGGVVFVLVVVVVVVVVPYGSQVFSFDSGGIAQPLINLCWGCCWCASSC
jgi:hypothetical protein